MKLQLFLLLLILPMMIIPAFADEGVELPRQVNGVSAIKLTDIDGVEKFVMFWNPPYWYEFPTIDYLFEFEYIDNPGTWHIMNIELDTISSVSINYDAILDTNVNLRITAINENGNGPPSYPIQITNNDELDAIRLDPIFGKNYDANTPLVISGEVLEPQYMMGEVQPVDSTIRCTDGYYSSYRIPLNSDNTFSQIINFKTPYTNEPATGICVIYIDNEPKVDFKFPFYYVAGVNQVDVIPEEIVEDEEIIIPENTYREILLQLQQELSNLKANIASLQNTAISIEDRINQLLEE